MDAEDQLKRSRRLRIFRAFDDRSRLGWIALLCLGLCSFVVISHGSDLAVGEAGAGREQRRASISASAIDNFWAIYHGNNYGQIPEAQAELAAAIQHDPGNPMLYALLGATHFWHVGEASRDRHPNLKVLREDMPTAAHLFQKALDLDYYAPHLIGYINDDHLPGYLGITTVHTGQQYGDPRLVANGDAVLDFAAYEFPEFNNFSRWAAYLTDPRDSETYKKALGDLWQGIDSCIEANVDRSNPDLKPYFDLYTTVGRKKACWWGNEIAPYSFEGYLLNLGNGLVKADRIESAKVVYRDATYAGNYATWPYRHVLQAIATSDLKARADLYADGNPGKEPPLGVPNRSCVYCHATKPEQPAR